MLLCISVVLFNLTWIPVCFSERYFQLVFEGGKHSFPPATLLHSRHKQWSYSWRAMALRGSLEHSRELSGFERQEDRLKHGDHLAWWRWGRVASENPHFSPSSCFCQVGEVIESPSNLHMLFMIVWNGWKWPLCWLSSYSWFFVWLVVELGCCHVAARLQMHLNV